MLNTMEAPAGAATLRVQRVPRFELEAGAVLREARQAYRLDGRLNDAGDNLVVVFHSLSAPPDPAGDLWKGVVGPGAAVDTERLAVPSPALLGAPFGSTAPSDLALDPFPAITLRDMVRLVRLLLDELGVGRVRLATGGSMGGMVALEWAATFPEA